MDEMPSPLALWQNAMKCVDKDPARVKSSLVDHQYRVPEHALLISPQSPEHHKLYMANWLAIQHVWISRLDHSPPSQFPGLQMWHDLLGSTPSSALDAHILGTSSGEGKKSKTESRKSALCEIFEDAMLVTQGSSWAPKEVVDW